jgi:hypothetical protein
MPLCDEFQKLYEARRLADRQMADNGDYDRPAAAAGLPAAGAAPGIISMSVQIIDTGT